MTRARPRFTLPPRGLTDHGESIGADVESAQGVLVLEGGERDGSADFRHPDPGIKVVLHDFEMADHVVETW